MNYETSGAIIMRLVLVHGINNENKSAADVEAIWMSALRKAWQRDGLEPLEKAKITTVYYAKELAELSNRARDAVVAGAGATASQVEFELLQEYANASGITQQEIVAAAEAGGLTCRPSKPACHMRLG